MKKLEVRFGFLHISIEMTVEVLNKRSYRIEIKTLKRDKKNLLWFVMVFTCYFYPTLSDFIPSPRLGNTKITQIKTILNHDKSYIYSPLCML